MIPKIEVLKFIDDEEIVGPMELANYFDMSYGWAKLRLSRLKIANLIEPLGIDRGKWILTNKAYDYLEFLRRREEDKD